MYSVMFNIILIVILIYIWSFNLVSFYKDREKFMPYECGFDPIGSARTPFSLRFFLLAVLFLVFDIEIVLLMILPLTMLMNNYIIYFLSILWFLIALLLGTIHELKEGSMNWAE